MRRFNLRFVLAGIAVAWGAIASAQAGQRGGFVGAPYEGTYYDNGYTAASQNSTIVTERRVITVASETQANMVLSQIADRLEGHAAAGGSTMSLLPPKGGNAGAGDHKSSVWARAGFDHMQEGNITRFGGWNANLWTLALGYDYKFNDRVLAGLALVYSNLNGSTKFNNGSIRDNAYGLVPYVAFRVAPCFDVDVMFGYSRVSKSRNRGTPSSVADNALSGTKASGSPKSDRWFAAIYGNLKHRIDRWNLLARLGYMYVTDKQKAFTEKNGNINNPANGRTVTLSDRRVSSMTTSVNRLSLRLQAGYKASHCVEPYAFLTYARDFGATKIKVPDSLQNVTGGVNFTDSNYVSPNKRRSNDTFGGGLGVNGNLGNNWTTGIEGAYTQSKKFKNWGGMLRLAKKF